MAGQNHINQRLIQEPPTDNHYEETDLMEQVQHLQEINNKDTQQSWSAQVEAQQPIKTPRSRTQELTPPRTNEMETPNNQNNRNRNNVKSPANQPISPTALLSEQRIPKHQEEGIPPRTERIKKRQLRQTRQRNTRNSDQEHNLNINSTDIMEYPIRYNRQRYYRNHDGNNTTIINPETDGIRQYINNICIQMNNIANEVNRQIRQNQYQFGTSSPHMTQSQENEFIRKSENMTTLSNAYKSITGKYIL